MEKLGEKGDVSALGSSSVALTGSSHKVKFKLIDAKHFKFVKEEVTTTGSVRITAQCLLCPNNHFITADCSSEANLLRHLKRKHSDAASEFENSKKLKPDVNQKNLPFQRISFVSATQKKRDDLIIKYIVKGMKPLSTVDDPDFIELLQGWGDQDKKFKIMTRATLTNRIKELYCDRVSLLRNLMSEVKYICLTADAWTGHRRSFLGVTAHWITKDWDRKSAVLACTRFQGQHTYKRIQEKLDLVMTTFHVKDRVVAVVTDNGANFVKAFKEFGSDFIDSSEPMDDAESETDLDSDEPDEHEEIFLTDMLDSVTNPTLPPHLRCASHTLNLIASKDIDKVKDKSLLHRAGGKCSKLWNLSSSPLCAEKIHNIIGVQLKTPGVTRWNGYYDALAHLMRYESKIGDLCNELGQPQFLPKDIEFLKEYLEISRPIALALDLLQGEKGLFLGALLPTLIKVKQILSECKSGLSHCRQYVDAYLHGIEARFGTLGKVLTIDEKNPSPFVIASISHPFYKLRWVLDIEGGKEKQAALKASFVDICRKFGEKTIQTEPETRTCSSNPLLNFSQETCGIESVENDEIELECVRFLNDTDISVPSLEKYPTVANVFRRYNTALPSSAPVERLFSCAGLILTKKRCRLSDELFEILVFLKYNWVNK